MTCKIRPEHDGDCWDPDCPEHAPRRETRTTEQERAPDEVRSYVYAEAEWPGGMNCPQCERDIDEGETIWSMPMDQMGARPDALQFLVVCAVCAGRAS